MSAPDSTSLRLRLTVGTIGFLGIAYGAWLVLTDQRDDHPIQLAKWMIATVIVHDGILVPATMALGWLISRFIPPRARRFVQGALIAGALVTAVAVFLIHRHGKSAPGQSLEDQNYTGHLWLILGVIFAVALISYVVTVLRSTTRRGGGRDHESPPL